jgi:hypothetical protein
MRFLFAFIIIVVILAAGWSGGWFWLAGWADRNADAVLTEIAERGVDVDCRDRNVVGFPFAMRLACSQTAVAERESGTRARLGQVTGGASVFAPTTARIDMASPVHLESPHLESPAEIRWNNAALDIGMGLNGPRDVSFDAAGLSTRLALHSLPDPGVVAAHATGTLAPSADGGTDASITFTDLALSVEGADFPPVSGSASGRLSVPPRALLSGRAGLAAPLSARAISLDLLLNGGSARLNAEGDISVDRDGILDGVITLRIAGAESLSAFIAELPPQLQKAGNAFVGALFAFGSPTTIDGEPASELTVEVTRGEARIGLIEFGLPRLPI